MKQWALITGASAGIGYELARVFARSKFNLVLLARNEALLRSIADELKSCGIETRVLAKDLSQPDVAAEIFEDLRNTPISVLVNNAGFGTHGPFAETDLKVQTQMMQVNVVALVQLTRLFLPQMLARRSGRILNVASTAAFQPGPFINVYYATKAFVYSFSYALAEELVGTGVHVTTLCPGMTRTEFFERARMRSPGAWLEWNPGRLQKSVSGG